MKNQKPNILFILTDQQHARMMNCTGNEYVHTPNMDLLAENGVRFDRAYCTNPVCSPSRFSLMTGKMPSEIGMRANAAAELSILPDDMLSSGLGTLLRGAGYEAFYGGKQHLPLMNARDLGFDVLSMDERDSLAEACSDCIKEERDRPFFLAASFINPHDICYMAIRDFASTEAERRILRAGKTELEILDEALKLPEGIGEEEFFSNYCPPLPDNIEPQFEEPSMIVDDYLKGRPFLYKARKEYSDKQWRMHRWAYKRLTESVDQQIGVVLDTLRDSGQWDNTVIIFTSDHGDMDGSHRMEHKTVFYEESANIPFIICTPLQKQRNVVDDTHVISNGLDLIPTILDYAGASVPKDLEGRSVKSLADRDGDGDWREAVPIENEIGRAIVTKQYKYCLYDQGTHREQLYDLLKDPGEMRSCAKDPQYKEILDAHRKLFAQQFEDIPNLK